MIPLKNKKFKYVIYFLGVLLAFGVASEIIKILNQPKQNNATVHYEESPQFYKYKLTENHYANFPKTPIIERRESENAVIIAGKCEFGELEYFCSIGTLISVQTFLEDKHEEILTKYFYDNTKDLKNVDIEKRIVLEDNQKVLFGTIYDQMKVTEFKMKIKENTIITKIISGNKIDYQIKSKFFEN